MYCLIYLLTNDINNKIYVGQTWQPLVHRWSDGKGYKNSQHIRNAIDKYGKEHFHYTVLTVCSTQNVADYWEDYFIIKYDSIENGYNLKGGGSRGKLPTYIIRKIAAAKLGTHWGHHSEATKRKMSLAKIGKVCSKEHKENISKSKSGKNHPFFGKKFSDETKKKMSVAQTGKKHSEISREKMSKSKTGTHRSDATKSKISIALQGENGPNAKLSNIQRLEIIEKRKAKILIKNLMKEYGVSKQTIIRVSKNK